MRATDLPLAAYADRTVKELASATKSVALAQLEGATLLYERASLNAMRIPNRTSAGGGCRLYDAIGDTIALNLARPDDRELLPALFEDDDLDISNDEAIAARIAHIDAHALLVRGRTMGLAIAAENELRERPAKTYVELVSGCPRLHTKNAPRVIDLSALWAGPLASHLLWLAGADVIKVESSARPDAMRRGDPDFYALLNQGKASVALDFTREQQALVALIKTSDIVIEAARPRALLQLGIDATDIVRTTPGLIWITITGHGAQSEAANWIGFGDDCGVAGGLSAALRNITGLTGFVGDAIADPLAGINAAVAAWQAWVQRRGGRFAISMSDVVAHAISESTEMNASSFRASLTAWKDAVGKPFAAVPRRSIGHLSAFGENTASCLAEIARC